MKGKEFSSFTLSCLKLTYMYVCISCECIFLLNGMLLNSIRLYELIMSGLMMMGMFKIGSNQTFKGSNQNFFLKKIRLIRIR